MVNDTRWCGELCICTRANWQGTLVVKTSPLPSLKKAISTILAQGNALQCRPLVQNRRE